MKHTEKGNKKIPRPWGGKSWLYPPSCCKSNGGPLYPPLPRPRKLPPPLPRPLPLPLPPLLRSQSPSSYSLATKPLPGGPIKYNFKTKKKKKRTVTRACSPWQEIEWITTRFQYWKSLISHKSYSSIFINMIKGLRTIDEIQLCIPLPLDLPLPLRPRPLPRPGPWSWGEPSAECKNNQLQLCNANFFIMNFSKEYGRTGQYLPRSHTLQMFSPAPQEVEADTWAKSNLWDNCSFVEESFHHSQRWGQKSKDSLSKDQDNFWIISNNYSIHRFYISKTLLNIWKFLTTEPDRTDELKVLFIFTARDHHKINKMRSSSFQQSIIS